MGETLATGTRRRRRWNPIAVYTHWLHTRWPAGKPEALPVVREDFTTAVPGLYVVGDLTGVPLLKLSADSGAKAVAHILGDRAFQNRARPDAMDSFGGAAVPFDLVIIGAGVAGMSAALEAEKAGLRFLVLESSEAFSTIANFPARKPIYTYPTEMTPAGELRFRAEVKEELVEELREQTGHIKPAMGRAQRVIRRGGGGGGMLEVELEPEVGEQADDVMPVDEAHRAKARPPRPLLAHRVIVAIGRSGDYRMLDVPGEDLPKVFNRLHDPKDYAGQRVLVVGGGDSALETAIALAAVGAAVTLSYRRGEFARAKPANVEQVMEIVRSSASGAPEVEKPADAYESVAVGEWMRRDAGRGSLTLRLSTTVREIREDAVVLASSDGQTQVIPNDAVFTMLGRDAPLEFFRKSGVPIANEKNARWWITLALSLLFFTWVYHWKADYNIPFGLRDTFNAYAGLDPAKLWAPLQAAGGYFADPSTLGGTLAISASGRSFYYTLVYSALIVWFGVVRIRRRRTPYVKWQTATLMGFQVLPLFLLPEIILPYMGHNGAFDGGAGKWFADTFFPEVTYGHGREYWRAYGFILAWPLMAWNWFTEAPLYGWLVLGFLQTFVAIPAMVYVWGKGAYCGWICSCGALAETVGDAHRHKMPHGPFWNRLNMVGQVFFAFALVLMGLRIAGWLGVEWAAAAFMWGAKSPHVLSWAWLVDLLWAGILGVALYFWFSGRVWCRFACPLAAWMHIVHRFSRFRILAEKKKCISCNVCTSVCHQGIDIMSFAQKGEPMADPQCVRCSACVQMCPTGVLSFGQVSPRTGKVLREDPGWLAASPVRMVEMRVNGRALQSSGK